MRHLIVGIVGKRRRLRLTELSSSNPNSKGKFKMILKIDNEQKARDRFAALFQPAEKPTTQTQQPTSNVQARRVIKIARTK